VLIYCSDQAVDLAGSILEKHGGDRKRFQSTENKHHLEMLLQLCDFNPMVMVCVSLTRWLNNITCY